MLSIVFSTLVVSQITFVNWEDAFITDDTTGSMRYYLRSNGDWLPNGWTVTVVDGNAGKVTCTKTASADSTKHYDEKSTHGVVRLRYKLKTTDNPQTSLGVVYEGTWVGYAFATIYRFSDLSWAKASAASGMVSVDVSEFEELNTASDDDTDQKRITGVSHALDGWMPLPNQEYETQFLVFSQFQGASAIADITGSLAGSGSGPPGGAAGVSSGSGSAWGKFFPVSARPLDVNSPQTPGYVKGTTQTFQTEVMIDVYTASGVLEDSWVVLVSDGRVVLPFDDYADGVYTLKTYAKGSLVSNVSVSYTDASGVGNVDFSLLYGDLNRDNYVSASEAQFVFDQIGSKGTDADWLLKKSPAGFSAYEADLNRDGAVTATDHALALSNVGVSGD